MQIKLENAGRQFNRNWLFRNLEAELHSSCSLAILGPNGSGKSTLLQVLAGWISLNEGTVGYRSGSLPITLETLYSHISIAAPYLELPEEFTLREVFNFQSSLKGSIDKINEKEFIELSGLQAAADRQIRYYSSGMKQRLKLSLAIIASSDLLLLDEPLTNLDRDSKAWYLDMIARFSNSRIVVVASNDPEEYTFCEQQIVLKQFK